MTLKNNKTIYIINKEWYRFFGDKRLVITALILPGSLLYIIYAFLAPLMLDLFIGSANNNIVYSINTSSVIQKYFDYADIELVTINEDDEDTILEGIYQKDGNFLLYFPPNFDDDVFSYNLYSGEQTPEILLYYNSLSNGFLDFFTRINAILNAYEKSISKKFDINLSGGGDLAQSTDSSNQILAAILPMFLLVFIYHGAIASATEAITGEKERGTLATILITPITTIELAIGKIVSLGTESFLCGISGTLGILFSVPKFIDNITSKLDSKQSVSTLIALTNIDMKQYTITDIASLLFVLLSCSFFIVTLVAIVSLNAKTVKEAQLTLTPLIIIIMLLGMLSTISNINQQNVFFNLIPIYNSVQSMNDIFSRSYLPVQIYFTIFSNVIFSFLGTLLLSKLYKNENVVLPT